MIAPSNLLRNNDIDIDERDAYVISRIQFLRESTFHLPSLFSQARTSYLEDEETFTNELFEKGMRIAGIERPCLPSENPAIMQYRLNQE